MIKSDHKNIEVKIGKEQTTTKKGWIKRWTLTIKEEEHILVKYVNAKTPADIIQYPHGTVKEKKDKYQV